MFARVLGSREGKVGFLGSIGVRFMIDGMESGGGFSTVEHPMAPRVLAAPLHKHTREDEYSFVLEGEVGALLGNDVLIGKPGDLIFKPRGQWHTSGTPVISLLGYSKSSHLPDLSGFSTNSVTLVG